MTRIDLQELRDLDDMLRFPETPSLDHLNDPLGMQLVKWSQLGTRDSKTKPFETLFLTFF